MTDCIVIGGGLIGMLTARELQQRGVEVLLLEKGVLGGESSWAGGGILSPLYPWRYADAVNVLARYGQQHWAAISQQLREESGIDPEYTVSGMLVLDAQPLDGVMAWAQTWRQRLELVRDEALHRLEPGLAADYHSALWLPEIAQVRNPRLVKSLRGSLQQRGIKFIEGAEVCSLELVHGRVQAVHTATTRYVTQNVVVAGGAWSARILQQLGQSPRVEPVKGQMIVLRGEPGQLKSIVLSQGRYLIPRRDGRILVGSTLEYTGFDKQITTEAGASLYASALKILPQLERLPIEHHWAGLRPGSEQGVPYICRHPQIDGLYINTGHFRNGVILGAASARLLTDLLTGVEPAIDPAFYDFEAPH